MLEYILMTQLYFTDGTYEFRNYNMISAIGAECSEEVKQDALAISSIVTDNPSEIRSMKAICTDKVQVLDFYPVPKNVPIPVSRPT